MRKRSKVYRSGKPLAVHVRALGLLPVLVGLALGIGCGKQGLKTVPVDGIVSIDGEAYTQGGSVVFQPVGKGKQAAGKIEPDGSFTLSTYTPGDGAIVGKHQAILMPAPVADIGDDQSPVKRQASTLAAATAKTPTTELVFEVKSGEPNHFDIELRTQ